MNSRAQAVPPNREELLPRIFAGLFGAFLGLCLLKFGNPPITEKWVTAPTGFWELLLGYPWPIAWAYWLLALVGVVAMAVPRRKSAAAWWLVALPLVWLVWQILAGTQSVDRRADPAHAQALCGLRAVLLSRLFFSERSAACQPFLGRPDLRSAGGPGCRLGATIWRLEGNAPILLSVHLSPVEGGIARVSEEDVERPHLLDSLLSEHPGRGPAAAAASHPGGAVASSPTHDDSRALVPDRAGWDRRSGLPLLVGIQRRVAVDADARSAGAVAAALQPAAEDRPGDGCLAGRAGWVLLAALGRSSRKGQPVSAPGSITGGLQSKRPKTSRSSARGRGPLPSPIRKSNGLSPRWRDWCTTTTWSRHPTRDW